MFVYKKRKKGVLFNTQTPNKQTNNSYKKTLKKLTVVVVNPAEAWLALILSVLLELKIMLT